MKIRLTLATLLTLGLGLGCANMHHEKEDESEGNEVKMSIDQVPPAVKAALMREAGGAMIKSVDKEEDHGKVIYETDVMMNGKNWEIKVDANGNLVGKKIDNEENEKGETK